MRIGVDLNSRLEEIESLKDSEAQDMVNSPHHYTSNPSGIECIDVVEYMNFNIGNAVKYLWRCDLKGDAIENLRKARWYITREIERRGME